ncbi:hypothetical protein N657DRAFT_265894 [Parathielavia appendiculata]|uniref:Uncharacterized protein n=1 Tax=Parathielavia appendiculata TaxID=2587402 RepID=A0AAN6U313_9PEZI|nr:hypothetical protein N657DRAFT_265894 [Parathielavia appendiculata]
MADYMAKSPSLPSTCIKSSRDRRLAFNIPDCTDYPSSLAGPDLQAKLRLWLPNPTPVGLSLLTSSLLGSRGIDDDEARAQVTYALPAERSRRLGPRWCGYALQTQRASLLRFPSSHPWRCYRDSRTTEVTSAVCWPWPGIYPRFHPLLLITARQGNGIAWRKLYNRSHLPFHFTLLAEHSFPVLSLASRSHIGGRPVKGRPGSI